MRCLVRALFAGLMFIAASPTLTGIARADDAGSIAATVGSESVARSAIDATVEPALAKAQRERDLQVRQIDFELEQKRAAIVAGEVERVLNDRVLVLEAAATHATRDELLARIKPRPVTDEDQLAFYQSRREQINQPYVRVQAQIREVLTQEAREEATRDYLRGLRTKYRAVSRLEPARVAVEAAGPARGPADAAVTMIEFADFQCPYCAQMEPILDQLRQAYPSQLRVVFRHLPLTSLHPLADGAAHAAVCADQQGRFWEMHDAMFRDQNALADEALKVTARRIGLEGETFDRCLRSSDADAKVQADTRAAEAIGLGGTPAFFINGRFFGGTAPMTAYRTVIDEELARLGGRGAARAGGH